MVTILEDWCLQLHREQDHGPSGRILQSLFLVPLAVANKARSYITLVSARAIASLLPGCLLPLPVTDQGTLGSLH